MKEVLFNNDNLIEEDIDETVIRVKALIINSKNEIMLGYCNKTYQFPGGHLEEGESLIQGLIREINEETGIEIKNINILPFEKIIHLSKNYRDTGKNRKNEIYYFIINTDESFNKNNMNLDDGEKEGNYTIRMIPLNDVEQVLLDSIPDNSINKVIVEEMLDVLSEYKRIKNIKLIPFRECINRDLYDMYQDIPKEEIGSLNILNGITYEEFKLKCNELINEEKNINKEINTTTNRYILYDRNIPIGEVGIRTTLNDFWINKGSQIYYKIRLQERGKGYGNIILNLALIEAKKLGFKKIRINCDDNNIKSRKMIERNGGLIDIQSYKTEDGYSTSYVINLD